MNRNGAKTRAAPGLQPRGPRFEDAIAALLRGGGAAPEVDAAIRSGLMEGADARGAAAAALLSGHFPDEPSNLALLTQRLRRVSMLAPPRSPFRERLREIAVLARGPGRGGFLLAQRFKEKQLWQERVWFGSLRLDGRALRSLGPEIKRAAARLGGRPVLPITLGLVAALVFLARRYGAGRLSPVLRRIVLAAGSGNIRGLRGVLPTPAAWLVREVAPRGTSKEPVYWPGLGAGAEVGGFLSLVGLQARECKHTYGLASRVSQALKRPVVLLCNASLAASVGWGIPGIHLQVDQETAPAFADAAGREERAASRRIREDGELGRLIDGLGDLFRSRIVAPGLAGPLGDLRALAEARRDPSLLDHQLVREAESLCTGIESGHLAPVARPAHEILKELGLYVEAHRAHKSNIRELFSLLRGILAAGEAHFPSRGLVVPWVDKFFMSSKRANDTGYLTSVCLALKRLCPNTVVILVDDTRRSRSPSLKLAIKEINSKGHGAEGLMIFGDGEEEPLPAILASGAAPLFYAVRPFLDTHNPRGFKEMIRAARSGLLAGEGYDSSWKDGLSFLYAGTAVEHLAGRVDERDPAPFLFVEDGTMPAGAFWRCALRDEALEGYPRAPGPLEEVWRRWVSLAGLG